MSNQVAVFLYELSGQSAEPFAKAGWDCYCIDLAHERSWSDGSIHYIKADARHWTPTREIMRNIAFFAAFPPCDHLSVSGARWFAGKGLFLLAQSIELFAIATKWAMFFDVPYFIENPVSTISSYWRKPDFTFHPWQFTAWEPRDNYNKKTCLWTGNNFKMPKIKSDCETIDDRVWKAPPGPNRKNIRSQTPVGFMRAVFDANFTTNEAT